MKFRTVWFATICGALGFLFVFSVGAANAASVTFYFSGLVTSVSDECVVASCDPLLSGPGSSAIGTRFSGQYTFDSAVSSIPGCCGSNEAHYASALSDTAFPSSIKLGGVNFSFSGLYFEVAQNTGNPHYQVQRNSDGTDGRAGGQLLVYSNWGFNLASGSYPWGDGTTNLPLTPPLLSQFGGRGFSLQAYTLYDLCICGRIGRQYFGFLDYLGDAPQPFVAPLPAALPLFATGLGALGLIGWRRKRKAEAA